MSGTFSSRRSKKNTRLSLSSTLKVQGMCLMHFGAVETFRVHIMNKPPFQCHAVRCSSTTIMRSNQMYRGVKCHFKLTQR